MTDLRKAAEMALDALEGYPLPFQAPIKEALRQALAQPVDAVNMTQERVDETAKGEHEPVAWFVQYEDSHEFVWSRPDGWRVKQALEIEPLYTAPPHRNCDNCESLRRAAWDRINELEAKLKEKNT